MIVLNTAGLKIENLIYLLVVVHSVGNKMYKMENFLWLHNTLIIFTFLQALMRPSPHKEIHFSIFARRTLFSSSIYIIMLTEIYMHNPFKFFSFFIKIIQVKPNFPFFPFHLYKLDKNNNVLIVTYWAVFRRILCSNNSNNNSTLTKESLLWLL